MSNIVPPRPTTGIPELECMDLSDQQYRAVVEIVDLASRLQERDLNPTGGPNLRWRIEVASAFLAAAIDHAGRAAEANNVPISFFSNLAAKLTVKRAKEILRQGSA